MRSKHGRGPGRHPGRPAGLPDAPGGTGDTVSGHGSVTTEVRVRLRVLNTPLMIPLIVTLTYTGADPYAVRAAFDVGRGEPTVWLLARDLLQAGQQDRAGEGDVRVSPGNGNVLDLELDSPHGTARMELPAPDVAAFLTSTYRLVPAGGEPAVLAEELDKQVGPGGALYRKRRPA